jgi:hypothetical protein
VTTAAVFRDVVARLDAASIPYMLTGSYASAYHGLPRATQDIDFVIAPTREQLRAFVGRLSPADYYVDAAAALEALAGESQFNLIDVRSGWKIGLICRRSRAFSRLEFERRTRADLDGIPLYVASAEDVILAKLEWAKLGGSARQVEDAAGIMRARRGELDLDYILSWVEQLGVMDQWNTARRAAGALA